MRKSAIWVLSVFCVLVSCQKKSDAPAPSASSATAAGTEKYYITFYHDGGKAITFNKVAGTNIYNSANRNLQVFYNTDKDTGSVSMNINFDQSIDQLTLPYQLTYTTETMDPAPVSLTYEERTDPWANAFYTSYSSPSVFRKSSDDGHINVLQITRRTAISIGGSFKGSMKQVFPQESYLQSLTIDSAKFNVAFARQ
jgi:hypothetical protein